MASTTTPPTSGATADGAAAGHAPGAAPHAADQPAPAAPGSPAGPATGTDDDESADEDDRPAPRLLTFRVGGRTMGCPLDVAREVLVAGVATRLPGAPAHVLGLQNVRGRLVTVVDLARVLDPDAPPAAGGHVLVVEGADGRSAGCRVDAVLRVVPTPELAPPAADGAGNAGRGGIVLGIGQVEGAPVTVLDLPRIVGETLVDPGER